MVDVCIFGVVPPALSIGAKSQCLSRATTEIAGSVGLCTFKISLKIYICVLLKFQWVKRSLSDGEICQKPALSGIPVLPCPLTPLLPLSSLTPYEP